MPGHNTGWNGRSRFLPESCLHGSRQTHFQMDHGFVPGCGGYILALPPTPWPNNHKLGIQILHNAGYGLTKVPVPLRVKNGKILLLKPVPHRCGFASHIPPPLPHPPDPVPDARRNIPWYRSNISHHGGHGNRTAAAGRFPVNWPPPASHPGLSPPDPFCRGQGPRYPYRGYPIPAIAKTGFPCHCPNCHPPAHFLPAARRQKLPGYQTMHSPTAFPSPHPFS